ncbi:MAG: class I SAM-dependent methyltransferase family protein, partial [Opitutales bacterium]
LRLRYPASGVIGNINQRIKDYKEVNVEAARRLRDELGLTGVIVEKGDAFALAESLPADLRFDVVLASGIYELFPQNDPVRQSLQQVADRLEPGGCLLYTNQPWHPQLELIARLLHNREGQPWIMRCRTQAEMDQLVAAAGLVKIAMDIDEFGVCSVSVARKPE